MIAWSASLFVTVILFFYPRNIHQASNSFLQSVGQQIEIHPYLHCRVGNTWFSLSSPLVTIVVCAEKSYLTNDWSVFWCALHFTRPCDHLCMSCGPCGFILNHRNCQDYLFQSLYRNLLNFDITPNFQFYNLCYVQILRRVSQSI